MKKKIIYNGKETNYSVTSDGKVFNDITGLELKGTYKTNEYHSIQLAIEGKNKTFLVHRLVAEAFCENPNNCNIVDHIDRNKLNNDYTNLRWVTSQENAQNRENKKARTFEFYEGDINEEDWKPIKGFENYLINKNTAQIINAKTKQILIEKDRHGYKRVGLNGHNKTVHKLLWETFIGEIPEDKVIDHIDGNKANNHLSNLRLVSQSENMFNAYRNGHARAIKVRQYNENGEYIKTFNNMNEAAREIGVTPGAIKGAADRHGTCKGFYWLKDNDETPIEKILNDWIPEGYKKLESFPTYCINRDGQVYNKRSKKIVPVKYSNKGTPYVNIGTTKKIISVLLKETNFDNE